MSTIHWVTSSYSNGDGGGCVEWAPMLTVSGVVPVRDSKDPDGPALAISAAGWRAFVAGFKAGEFPVHL
ncbi:DUF397 domain-containing protein [Streptomyces aculeolatus]|uniref:DUF397 domain-containing protein n=1 Tax=Streptomyces aculeolatus TaxID=270689 RepID=UPI001CED86C1|nr:DUF397 domain-containing protein [Streptomyces aculeolatus]